MKSIKAHKGLTAMLAAVLVLVSVAVQRATTQLGPATAPAVATNHTGYLAGEAVTITGSGFGANASISLSVAHADGSAASGAPPLPAAPLADSAGAFTATWSIDAL